VVALAGCSEPAETGGGLQQENFPTAATLGEQDVRTVAEYLAMAPYASADRERGARLAGLCRACHTFGAGEPAMLGPNLHGVFGRRAGSSASFDYSPVLREAHFVWTPRALDAWLAQPARFLPGNRMSFTGVHDAGDRASLIAYLLEVSDGES
jgi:cytochrome c